MRLHATAYAILLAGLLGCSGGGAGVTALTGGTLYDGTGADPVTDAVVLVRGDSILCAGPREACPVKAGAAVRDLSGKYVTPGIVDAHVHVGQTGWLDGRPESIDLRARYPYDSVIAAIRDDPDRWYRSYLCDGITAVYDVGGMAWSVAQARRDAARRDAPHMAAAGPLISHGGRPILAIPGDSTFIMLTSAEAGVEGVRKLKAMRANAVKAWLLGAPDSLWPELRARYAAVAAEAKAKELPLIVHATGLREAKAALEDGAFMLVHSVSEQPVDSAFVAALARQGTIYVPTLVVVRNWGIAVLAGARGEAPSYNDPLGCVDPATKALLADAPALPALYPDAARIVARAPAIAARADTGESIAFANLRQVHDAGVTIAVGTDAGNPLTLHGASIHDELRAMERAGISPRELIVMATRNGARAMRRTDIGTIERGKSADLLVLGADPGATAAAFERLEAVMLKGRWVKGATP